MSKPKATREQVSKHVAAWAEAVGKANASLARKVGFGGWDQLTEHERTAIELTSFAARTFDRRLFDHRLVDEDDRLARLERLQAALKSTIGEITVELAEIVEDHARRYWRARDPESRTDIAWGLGVELSNRIAAFEALEAKIPEVQGLLDRHVSDRRDGRISVNQILVELHNMCGASVGLFSARLTQRAVANSRARARRKASQRK